MAQGHLRRGGPRRGVCPVRHRRRPARSADAPVHLAGRRPGAAATGCRSAAGVGFKHLETFEIGDSVFIGAQAYIQGRFDGTTIIGNHVWIGPQAYMDARDLVLEDYVGWGPGAKVLGSAHTGLSGRRADRPHRPRDQAGADRRLGRHRHQRDDPAGRHHRPRRHRRRRRRGDDTTCRRSPIVAGVPARFLRWREGAPDAATASAAVADGAVSSECRNSR